MQDSIDSETALILPQTIFPSSLKNILTRIVCFSAVSLEPLFSVFLWQSTVEAAEKAIEMFGGSLNEPMKNYIRYFAIPFVVANLINDLTSVDPLREADTLTAPTGKQNEEEYVELSKRVLGIFIKLLAVITSFPVGASTDALPLSDLIAQFAEGLTGDILRYGGLALITFLAVVYYMMFTNSRIQKHANEFIDTLKNLPEFFQKFFHNPGKYLEVWIQAFSNAFYRSISFAYILEEVGQKIFKVDQNNPYLRRLTLTTGATTFLVTLFSRLLSTRDKFLNPAFDTLTDSELDETPRLRKTLIYDAISSLIRGGAVTTLLFELIPLSLYVKYGISLTAGFLVTSHSFYVRYHAGYYEDALKLRKQKSIQIVNENDNLLSVNTTEKIEDIPQLFDRLAATHNSSGMNFTINTINFMARITRFIAFFLFVATINQLFLDNSLNGVGILALIFLWGAEVFKNDGDVYGEALRSTWQGLAAKWQLEKEGNDTAKLSCFSGTLFRPLRVIGKSPFDYSPELMEKTLSSESRSNLQYT